MRSSLQVTTTVLSLRGRVLPEKLSLSTFGDIAPTPKQGQYGHKSHVEECWGWVVPTAQFKAAG